MLYGHVYYMPRIGKSVEGGILMIVKTGIEAESSLAKFLGGE